MQSLTLCCCCCSHSLVALPRFRASVHLARRRHPLHHPLLTPERAEYAADARLAHSDGKRLRVRLAALNSMASLYLAQGDQDAVSRVVAKAMRLAPDDADTVLNGAALMWETEFRRVRQRLPTAEPVMSLGTRPGRLPPS